MLPNVLKLVYYLLTLGCLVTFAWYAGHISTAQVDAFLNTDSAEVKFDGSGQLFDRIASTYDILNEVISLGYQTSWRHAAVSKIIPSKAVLDIATGTGDIALAFSARQLDARVVGVDPSEQMLARATSKVTAAGSRVGNIQLVKGTAEQLSFEDESFDAVITAFGVRNFQDRTEGIRQIARVLSTNGKFVILEASSPKKKSGPAYIVSRLIIKGALSIAGVISGNMPAYQYLLNSMDSFPHKDQFTTMLEQAGFDVVEYSRLQPMGFGPELYVAIKRDVQFETHGETQRERPSEQSSEDVVTDSKDEI